MYRRACLLLTLPLLASCGVVKVVNVKSSVDPNTPVRNFTFEQGRAGDEPSGWKVTTNGPDGRGGFPSDVPLRHRLELTDKVRRSGKQSAHLRPIDNNLGEKQNGGVQFCGKSPYPGSALIVTVFLRGSPRVSFQADLGNRSIISGLAREWSKFEAVVLPADEGHLCLIFFTLSGKGSLWIDDLTVKKLDLSSISPGKVRPLPLDNLDMEKAGRGGRLASWELVPWTQDPNKAGKFEMISDASVKHSGSRSLRISTEAKPDTSVGGSGAIHCSDATAIRGSLVRAYGWIRTDTAESYPRSTFGLQSMPITIEEALALRASGRPIPALNISSGYKDLPARADWTRYEVFARVPQDSILLCLSVALMDVGTIWADDISVEILEL